MVQQVESTDMNIDKAVFPDNFSEEKKNINRNCIREIN
jgi:hypothetical protein